MLPGFTTRASTPIVSLLLSPPASIPAILKTLARLALLACLAFYTATPFVPLVLGAA
jgi:hypothetical protein